MLRARELSVVKSGKTICHVAELDVARGEHVAVIGANGSGKTTLLRVASGLERDFAGECQVEVPMLGRVYAHQTPFLRKIHLRSKETVL